MLRLLVVTNEDRNATLGHVGRLPAGQEEANVPGSQQSEPPWRSSDITRREGIQLVGGGAVVAMVPPGAPGSLLPVSGSRAIPATGMPLNLTAIVTRREDMFLLTFEFWNLRLEQTADGPVLVPAKKKLRSYLVAVFGPQAVGEEAQSVTLQQPPPLSDGITLRIR